MKHLKTFESMKELHLSDEEIDDIKDVFQDLIDEYDIQKITPQTPVGKIQLYHLIIVKTFSMLKYF